MIEKTKKELKKIVNDSQLIENLFLSYRRISEEYISQNPVKLFQNIGLFIESAMRVTENLIFGNHTPISKKFDLDSCIEKLEEASGSQGLRIHVSRLSRAAYDFRSRKKGVHLKEIDPETIDASLIFNIITWILIEILKESGIQDPDKIIYLLFSRKIPLVQEAGGVLRTTNPKLSGTERILLLLYSTPKGLTEQELFEGTKRKIKNKKHLQTNLRNMDNDDRIHKLSNGRWILFGRGFGEAEKVIKKFS